MYRGLHGGWGFDGQVMGFPWGGIVMAILAIALIALLIIAIARMGKMRETSAQGGKDRGLDILVERYAKGEIDAETFRAMKSELGIKE
jgi:putative membrane protein